MRQGSTRGQVTLEVAVLFAVVGAALIFMSMYLQRGTQGGVKSSADSFGSPFSGNQSWRQMSASATAENDEVAATSVDAVLTGLTDAPLSRIPKGTATSLGFTGLAAGEGHVKSQQLSDYTQRVCEEKVVGQGEAATLTFDCTTTPPPP